MDFRPLSAVGSTTDLRWMARIDANKDLASREQQGETSGQDQLFGSGGAADEVLLDPVNLHLHLN